MDPGSAQSTNNASYAAYSASAPGTASTVASGGPSALSQVGSGLSAANNALGIINGLRRGGISGYGGAAINAGTLAAKAGALPSSASQYLGPVSDVLNIYNGVKQGGVLGDANAALGAAQLAGSAANIYAGGAAAAQAAGGATAAASSVGAAAAGAALPLGLFAAQYGLYEKQSQFTPAQQYAQLEGELARLKSGPQTGATPQDVQTVKAMMSLWNPQTQTFDMPYDVGGPTQRQGGNQL